MSKYDEFDYMAEDRKDVFRKRERKIRLFESVIDRTPSKSELWIDRARRFNERHVFDFTADDFKTMWETIENLEQPDGSITYADKNYTGEFAFGQALMAMANRRHNERKSMEEFHAGKY